MIYSLCYIRQKEQILKSEINSIIETSKNEANGISGILIEYKNHFIQHIEGDAVVIYELFENKIGFKHEKHLLHIPLENRPFDINTHRIRHYITETNIFEMFECIDDVIENKFYGKESKQ